jgi:hypothetical protein
MVRGRAVPLATVRGIEPNATLEADGSLILGDR